MDQADRLEVTRQAPPGCQFSWFFHDVIEAPGVAASLSIHSQYTPPSLVLATLVNTVLDWIVSIAMGFVDIDVPKMIR